MTLKEEQIGSISVFQSNNNLINSVRVEEQLKSKKVLHVHLYNTILYRNLYLMYADIDT